MVFVHGGSVRGIVCVYVSVCMCACTCAPNTREVSVYVVVAVVCAFDNNGGVRESCIFKRMRSGLMVCVL